MTLCPVSKRTHRESLHANSEFAPLAGRLPGQKNGV